MLDRFAAARFVVATNSTRRVAVAVSACLAGQRVRYDGDDKLLPAFKRLNRELELIAICPEVGAGLSVPRPPVQLIADDTHVRALGRDDRAIDVTEPLQTFAQFSLDRLIENHALCGYLWKSRSPSCGFNSTPLFDKSGHEIGQRSGIQATHFQRTLPWLCCAQETDLIDEQAIDCFVLRCRLAFEIRYSDIPLATLHRHYQFLIARFPAHARTQLHNCCESESKEQYLTALHDQCGQIDRRELLGLFGV